MFENGKIAVIFLAFCSILGVVYNSKLRFILLQKHHEFQEQEAESFDLEMRQRSHQFCQSKRFYHSFDIFVYCISQCG